MGTPPLCPKTCPTNAVQAGRTVGGKNRVFGANNGRKQREIALLAGIYPQGGIPPRGVYPYYPSGISPLPIWYITTTNTVYPYSQSGIPLLPLWYITAPNPVYPYSQSGISLLPIRYITTPNLVYHHYQSGISLLPTWYITTRQVAGGCSRLIRYGVPRDSTQD